MKATITTDDRTVELNAKQVGKLLRKFRDDCAEHKVGDLHMMTKKDDVSMGELFISFICFGKY